MSASSPLPSIWQASRALLLRDLRLLWRRRGDAFQPALLALLIVVLFALALGGRAESLAQVAPAVMWVAVLLAGLLSLDSLFRGDAEDGTLEQWLLAPTPLAWLVLVRVLLHWATTALPLIVVAPILGELLHLRHDQL
ncbi:MAG TPA: heme exporter protein CcmB, partial [Stenotrophomonas sp.]